MPTPSKPRLLAAGDEGGDLRQGQSDRDADGDLEPVHRGFLSHGMLHPDGGVSQIGGCITPLLLDGVLIPVNCLLNDTTIVQVPVEEVTYYHVELPSHGVLLQPRVCRSGRIWIAGTAG